jgi:DNA ligase 4
MIIYYDILLIDNESLLGVRHSDRFKRLAGLIHCRSGRAELVPRQVISFDRYLAASDLRRLFARAIVGREEGLVLKPNDTYFNFGDARDYFTSCCIKMKKEYIGGFGEVGDFAVIGAVYDPIKAKRYQIRNLQWTDFFIGCLDNKDAVQTRNEKPEFTVVNVVELPELLLKTVVTYGTPHPVPYDENDKIILRTAAGVDNGRSPTVVFTQPMVFDMRCFSFDLVGNTGFWSLRFPSVAKVHFDRSYLDTISFTELQSIAEEAKNVPEMEDSQELLEWIAKLEGADPRGRAVDARSQSTVSSVPTPSPRPSSLTTGRPFLSPMPDIPESQELPIQSPINNFNRPETYPGTPPTSSLTYVETASLAGVDQPTTPKTPSRDFSKRKGISLSPSQQSSKRQKASPTSPRKQKPSPRVQRRQKKSPQRQPLGNIDGNTSFSQPTVAPSPPQHEIIDLTGSFENGGSFSKTSEAGHPKSDKQVNSSQTLVQSSPVAAINVIQTNDDIAERFGEFTPHSGCKIVKEKCLLSHCNFLLSPEVLALAKVTEELLPAHGINNFITDPNGWATGPKPSKSEGPRVRKLCLVDSRYKTKEHEFLLKVENVPMFLSDGATRSWNEIYDWKILEALREREDEEAAGDTKGLPRDPWRKYYLGLV